MSDDLCGTVIDRRYRLDSVLGRGAMGVVYRAVQLGVDGGDVRAVAVKMIRPELRTLGPHIEQRFQQEINAAAQLRGPHTIRVYDFGRCDAGFYYVMELVDGPTLKQVLERSGPLSPSIVVTIGAQICEALAEAHALKPPVVHRDLKPGNVFIEGLPDGVRTRVGDFGLAKVLSDETLTMSTSGLLVGAPAYMAPEQCRGLAVDARADLYALGIVLYESLTGHPPFKAQHVDALMYQHVHEPPPPLPAAVPEALRRIVKKLLSKNPDDRLENATACQREIEKAGAPVESPRLRRRISRALALSVILAMLAVAAGLSIDIRRLRPAFSPEHAAPATDPARTPQRKPPISSLPRIAVLAFRNERDDDRDYDWIQTALQTTFSTELGRVRELRVVSRETLEESARDDGGVLRTLRSLGAKKFISGSFAVFSGRIRVDAHLVDVESGDQERAESVEGGVEEFFGLQKRLALAMLEHLPVRASETERDSIARGNPSENQSLAVDAYRLMLQGEGLDEDDEGEDDSDRGSLLAPSTIRYVAAMVPALLGPPAAHADENGAAEQEIQHVLEEYRRSLETGDLDGIRKTRGSLSPKRRKGLEEYFKIAADLKVEFDRVEIRRVDEKQFAVSYVRRDEFSDRRTGEKVSLEVQLENTVVRDGDQWRIKNRKALTGQ